jgi:hypothetical protein
MSPIRNSECAIMLFDRYTVLNSDEARDEFVGALIHRLLVERARRSHFSAPDYHASYFADAPPRSPPAPHPRAT